MKLSSYDIDEIIRIMHKTVTLPRYTNEVERILRKEINDPLNDSVSKFKVKLKTMELEGEALLNHAPELQDICQYINHCTCSARWCEHEMRNLAALEEARHIGEMQGLREAKELIK